MKRIGLLSFKQTALERVPALRLRALLAEAALQGFELVLLETTYFDHAKELIQAHVWSKKTGWKPKLITLPDLIILMGTGTNAKHKKMIRWIKNSRPVIADVGLDKIKTSKVLQDTSVGKYIIQWDKAPKTEVKLFISNMLLKHPDGIVIKRANGNRGNGLFFITNLENGDYLVRYNAKSFLGTVEEVSQFIEKSISARLQYRDYVVQRYIKSQTPDGRSYDIRVHVQKREDGKWNITRGYVRLSEENSPLPNTSKGGYQGSLEHFLTNKYPDDFSQINKSIYDAALAIATTQESFTRSPLSELGIDLLLENENIYLIETNALPQSSRHEHESAIHTIGYASYLIKQYEALKA